jgi:hypothetical protein
MNAHCATALVLNKWDITDEPELDYERARVKQKLRLRPKVLTASALTGRHVTRVLDEAVALSDRMRVRIPTPDLNRFLAEVVQKRQPPAKQNHRLKLIYMAQIGERPPRFAIQVNSRNRVTRDYAYFVENQLRERYGFAGCRSSSTSTSASSAAARSGRREREPRAATAPDRRWRSASSCSCSPSSCCCAPAAATPRRRPTRSASSPRRRSSTSTSRPTASAAPTRTRRAARRVRGYKRQRDAILQRLSGGSRPVDFERDVQPWLGDEGAFALLNAGTATAGSLVVVEVTDEEKARAFLDRNPRRPIIRQYKEEPIAEYGSVAVAFKDSHLLVGQGPSVQAAMDRANNRGRSLDEVPEYRRAARSLPEGRVADAYATADGLRRLLIPQGDVVGTLAALLDQPALQAVSLGAEPADEGARVRTRSILARRGRDGGSPLRPFEPSCSTPVPENALAYLGVNGISEPLGRVIGNAAGGSAPGASTSCSTACAASSTASPAGACKRDLLDLLRRETAVVLSSATPGARLGRRDAHLQRGGHAARRCAACRRRWPSS